MDHAAQAIFSRALEPEAERILQRSADRGPQAPPINADDWPAWNHDVPMILLRDLYDPAVTTRRPPRGNVVYIDPGLPEPYLLDLARLGVIDLEQNPACRDTGIADLVIPD